MNWGQVNRLIYFNNGIVALCDGIEKKPLGGDSRDTGCFVCRGVSVVNGAQTVGAIAQAARMGRDLSQARVFVRFIATTNCPPEFASEVTRATNTQNRIERQDFAALDPQQARLKSEMLLDGKQYAYKTGENPPPSRDGCTLVDATIALACSADDAALAVQAKREVGKLWEDIERPPYRLLFNASLTSTRLWRCVEVMRAVDEYLESNRAGRAGRDRLILVHGNRFILRMVFRLIPPDSLTNVALDASESWRAAIREVSRVVEATIAKWNELFENAYPANLFKNLTRCRQLESAVSSVPSEYSGTLFPDA